MLNSPKAMNFSCQRMLSLFMGINRRVTPREAHKKQKLARKPKVFAKTFAFPAWADLTVSRRDRHIANQPLCGP
jgi:hypothetical protein